MSTRDARIPMSIPMTPAPPLPAPPSAREIMEGYRALTNRHGVNARAGEEWLEERIAAALAAVRARPQPEL